MDPPLGVLRLDFRTVMAQQLYKTAENQGFLKRTVVAEETLKSAGEG